MKKKCVFQRGRRSTFQAGKRAGPETTRGRSDMLRECPITVSLKLRLNVAERNRRGHHIGVQQTGKPDLWDLGDQQRTSSGTCHHHL